MKKNKICDWIEQEQIINLPWISRDQINLLIPLGYSKLGREILKLEDYLREKNISFFSDTRPKLYPTCETLKFFKIDINTIRQQAKQQRKYSLYEKRIIKCEENTDLKENLLY